MKPRKKRAGDIIPLSAIATIARWDEDRWVIRRTICAELCIPGEHDVKEIISIKPGHFATTIDHKVIPNVGTAWRIRYHVRRYEGATSNVDTLR